MKTDSSTNTFIYVKPAIAWIRRLESTKPAIIKKSGIFESDLPIKLNRALKSFEFSLNYEEQFNLHGNLNLGPYKDNLHISIDGQKYITIRAFIEKHSPPTFSGSIDQMHTEGYSESAEHFYRMLIPLEKELRFHYQLQESFFDSDFGYTSRTGTKCTISGDELILTVFHDNDRNYFLSIESKVAQNFDSFSDKAFAARDALAYVSGYFAGDSCYFLTYPSKNMKKPQHMHFLSIRSTMRSHYEPINTNPYSRLYYDRPIADQWHKAECLRPLSIQEFSRLGELIYMNQDFASAIILILESSVASLLFRPGGYAIALETIAPLIFTEKKKTLAPITDKQLWKNVRNELLEVIDDFKNCHPEHNSQILKNKINNLNTPTNKSKLQAPFEHLNIPLFLEDLAILETRNDLLHGRVPDITKAGKERSIDRINFDLYYSSLRLSTLLSMLILKWIGYDNYVLNYPKINEQDTGIQLNETPYRKV